MSYGNEHETSYLRTYAFSGGARGARGRSSLLRSLRTPPLPDTFSQCSRRARTTDSQKPGVRTANSARRHPRLQQARAGCSQSDLLATHRGPRRLRRAECALSLRELLHRSARELGDRKSTRLNSSHTVISYAVFCLKKKKKQETTTNNIKKEQKQQDK